MKHTWIMSVLEDVERYAKINNLDEIAASLSELRIIAASEIATKERVKADLCAALETRNSNVVQFPQFEEDLADLLQHRTVVITQIL